MGQGTLKPAALQAKGFPNWRIYTWILQGAEGSSGQIQEQMVWSL
jgi:hypothetical protein